LDLDCLACGACCAFSESWPAFIGDRDGEGIPDDLIDFERERMQCYCDRCSALVGDIGSRAQCSVYENRPLVCREFQSGSEDCIIARRRFDLPAA
jgi:hypothetical protein